MRPIDMQKLHQLEEQAREIGVLIGRGIEKRGKYGFCLMLFDFDGPELTWISNSNRDDMIKVLDEFKTALFENTADKLSRPRGQG